MSSGMRHDLTGVFGWFGTPPSWQAAAPGVLHLCYSPGAPSRWPGRFVPHPEDTPRPFIRSLPIGSAKGVIHQLRCRLTGLSSGDAANSERPTGERTGTWRRESGRATEHDLSRRHAEPTHYVRAGVRLRTHLPDRAKGATVPLAPRGLSLLRLVWPPPRRHRSHPRRSGCVAARPTERRTGTAASPSRLLQPRL